MKIAVVGCGALGSFYGARLLRAGGDVTFLPRSDFDVVREQGVRIRSVEGDFSVHPKVARHASEIGLCDLVVIGLKTTANHLLPSLLPGLVGPQTLLLTLQNGLGNEECLARLFGPGHVLGGLCFVCLNRVQPGVIEHLAHGRVTLGEYGRPAQPRTHQLAAMFNRAGVSCDVADDLEAVHWSKLVWNIPFNGLGVAGVAGYDAVISGDLPAGKVLTEVLPADRLLGEPRWEWLVRELMREVIAIARACGHDLPDELEEDLVERTRVMGAYKASTLVDFERGLPIELESLFLLPLARARAAGLPVPRLTALCRVLQQLDARPRPFTAGQGVCRAGSG